MILQYYNALNQQINTLPELKEINTITIDRDISVVYGLYTNNETSYYISGPEVGVNFMDNLNNSFASFNYGLSEGFNVLTTGSLNKNNAFLVYQNTTSALRGISFA